MVCLLRSLFESGVVIYTDGCLQREQLRRGPRNGQSALLRSGAPGKRAVWRRTGTANNRMGCWPIITARRPENPARWPGRTWTASTCARASPSGSMAGRKRATHRSWPAVKNVELWQRLDELAHRRRPSHRVALGQRGHRAIRQRARTPSQQKVSGAGAGQWDSAGGLEASTAPGGYPAPRLRNHLARRLPRRRARKPM